MSSPSTSITKAMQDICSRRATPSAMVMCSANNKKHGSEVKASFLLKLLQLVFNLAVDLSFFFYVCELCMYVIMKHNNELPLFHKSVFRCTFVSHSKHLPFSNL